MTTNQKLREDMKRCAQAFDRVVEERDLLREQLAQADREAKVFGGCFVLGIDSAYSLRYCNSLSEVSVRH